MSSRVEESQPSSATLEIAAAPISSAWQVEVQDDDGARHVPLSREKLTVGSSSSADVVMRDATVSARHCTLSVLGAGVAIEDLGSLNGTFVGSARIREAWARAGTAISVGRTTLVVAPVDSRELAPPPGESLNGVAGRSIVMRRLADQVRRLARH